MSNLEKARAVASEWIDLMGGLDNISYLYGDDIGILVQVIHAAGLLMPDLPEPSAVRESHTAFWLDGDVYAHEGSGKVRVIVDDARFPVDEAREHALSVLAACDYAEKEQGNE